MSEQHTPVAWEWFDSEGNDQISRNDPPEWEEVLRLQPLFSLESFTRLTKQRDQLQAELTDAKDQLRLKDEKIDHITEALIASDDYVGKVADLEKQRDELLAALQEALICIGFGGFSDEKLNRLANEGHMTVRAILRFRELIASVKGGEA